MTLSLIDDVRLADLRSSGTPVVVDFYAEWCRPCHALTPEISTLADRFDGVEFVKVDVDAHPGVAVDLNIRSVPTVIRFGSDGEEAGRSVGAVRADELARRLNL